MKRRLQVDDEVIVIAGKDKGRRGYIVSFSGEDRVLVGNINVVQRHTKAAREGEQSGILSKEAPIHISNVVLYNPNTEKRDKVKFAVEDGEKVRVYRSNGEKV